MERQDEYLTVVLGDYRITKIVEGDLVIEGSFQETVNLAADPAFFFHGLDEAEEFAAELNKAIREPLFGEMPGSYLADAHITEPELGAVVLLEKLA